MQTAETPIGTPEKNRDMITSTDTTTNTPILMNTDTTTCILLAGAAFPVMPEPANRTR